VFTFSDVLKECSAFLCKDQGVYKELFLDCLTLEEEEFSDLSTFEDEGTMLFETSQTLTQQLSVTSQET
jgi:hypothetical protein